VSEYDLVSKTQVEPRRSFDVLPVGVDWHDFLRKERPRGKQVNVGYTFRFARRSDLNSGLQFRCTTAGVTSGFPETKFRWPIELGKTIQDGTAVWTAEAMSAASLESTITSEQWVCPELTLENPVNTDLQYQTDTAGGTSGSTYEVAHQVTLANGWKKEWIIVLPIAD